MLRLSRSHDQNRRRAGETAGKAAIRSQCSVMCLAEEQENTADGHRNNGKQSG